MLRHRLLSPSDVPPLRPDLRCIGVFNPGAIQLRDGRIVLVVRVAVSAEGGGHERQLPLLSWQDGKLRISSVSADEVDVIDNRMVRIRSTGLSRLTFASYLQLVWIDPVSADPADWHLTWGEPILPEGPLETFGIEDARITFLEETYYITYVAVSEHGVSTALMSTDDFASFARHGTIFYPENKDVVLFPERIDERYFAMHRPNPRTGLCRPEIWSASSANLVDWGRHRPLLGGCEDWESAKIGGGTPPVRVEQGWLTVYHGNRRTESPRDVGTYESAGLLLDYADPHRILARSAKTILSPELEWEVNGFVPNVVFPTGLILQDDWVYLFYGAADTHTAVARLSISELQLKYLPGDRPISQVPSAEESGSYLPRTFSGVERSLDWERVSNPPE